MKADSLNFKRTVIVPCQMKRTQKRRHNISVSPCKHSRHSAVCRLEQPACCGWRRRRIFCGEGVESKPEPIIPLCLLRLQTAQISHEALPSCCTLICQSSSSPQSGRRRALVHHPTASPLLSSHLVDMESSVKGRPLCPLHLSIDLGHYFDPTPLTFR